MLAATCATISATASTGRKLIQRGSWRLAHTVERSTLTRSVAISMKLVSVATIAVGDRKRFIGCPRCYNYQMSLILRLARAASSCRGAVSRFGREECPDMAIAAYQRDKGSHTANRRDLRRSALRGWRGPAAQDLALRQRGEAGNRFIFILV